MFCQFKRERLIMKKILLVAASTLAFTSAAHADHNYAGVGLGWTAASAKAKTNTDYNNGNRLNRLLFPNGTTFGNKGRMTDYSAFAGTLFVGRAFTQGDSAFTLDFKVGIDSTNAKMEKEDTYIRLGNNYKQTMKNSLKRKYTLGVSVGYSKKLFRDVSGYAKMSLLLSRFSLSHQHSGSVIAPVNNTAGAGKTDRFRWGFGPTFGLSKPLSGDLTLNVDYTFEMYQSIEHKSAQIENTVANLETGHSIKATPMYHTVMVSLSKKF